MGRIGKKKKSQVCIENDLIFLDLQSWIEKKDILNNFFEQAKGQHRICVIGDKYQEADTKECFFVERGTSAHKLYLKKAHTIVTDQTLPEYFTPQKKQCVYFLALQNFNSYSLDMVQRTCRLSDFNLFSSFNLANEFLSLFHIAYILGSKNLVYQDIESLFKNILTHTFSDLEAVKGNGKKNILVHISKIINKDQEKFIFKYLSELPQDNNYFVLSPDMSNFEFIHNSSLDIQYLVYKKSRFSLQERIILKSASVFLMCEHIFKGQMDTLLRKNIQKKIKGYHFDEVIDLYDTNRYMPKELGQLKCIRKNINMSPYYIGLSYLEKWFQKNQKYKNQTFDTSETIHEFIVDNENKESCYNMSVRFYRQASFIQDKKDRYQFTFFFKYRSLIDFDIDQLEMYADDVNLNGSIKKGLFFNRCVFSISKDAIVNMPAQNKLFFVYTDSKGYGFKRDIQYTSLAWLKNNYLKSKIVNVDGHTSFYLRQSLKNRIYLTVRLHNQTDAFIENLKMNLAYYIAKIYRKKIYILYEKDSSRYEESASVVYENMIDQGYTNAYFILDKHYQDIDKIKPQYKKNIIYKYTFKHYLYFFMSQTFLGSELMIHALELRCMNRHVLKKINSTDVNYVFLQHGVMYMVSLDSESRKYFNPKKDGKGRFRVVTSSQKEADHFTQLGGYDPKQVIICGLPKYDRNVLYNEANSIVVMLTWRVWEYNQATTDFESTPYYKMLQRIVEGIDEEYRKHLIILPHPLFYKAAQNNEFELKKYMQFNVKYDEILRNTRVLITDYSSIAYDAFYRGSRVIFYWEELNECLEKYGPHTKLMLNTENVFGDVCYHKEDLRNVLADNYQNEQKQMFIQRYNEIVEFHDGKNTLRLIEQLKKENIL